jgi:hypothetical protein
MGLFAGPSCATAYAQSRGRRVQATGSKRRHEMNHVALQGNLSCGLSIG